MPAQHARGRLRGGVDLLARVTALVAAACLISLAVAAPGHARSHVPPSTPEEWLGLSRELGAAWVHTQDAAGFYPDFIYGTGVHTRYGEAMLGYAQLMSAFRDGDEAALESGVRAVNWAVLNPAGGRRMPFGLGPYREEDASVFENMAIAASYNLLVRGRPEHPVFGEHRHAWEERLRRIRLKHIGRRAYFNKHAVESVAALELLRTGLTSPYPGALLHDRAAARRAVRSIVNEYAPRHAAERLRPLGQGRAGFVLSDPPVDPPAYDALSFGFYARAVELLGEEAGEAARRVLTQIAEASWALAAPDGAVAYWGRSQEQAWAAAWTGYGAEMAARVASGDARGRFQALADRTLRRVIAAHGVRPEGLNIVPALRQDFLGRRGLDHYAGATDYNGNAFVALNWAIGARASRRAPTFIGSDRGGVYVIGSGKSRFAVVRRPRTWYAVKQTITRPVRERRRYIVDLRYDFGLVTLKRLEDGEWVDAVPQRPFTVDRRRPDSAGPTLLLRGRRYWPHGFGLTVRRGGVLEVPGRFISSSGRRGHRTRFEFRPTADGVLMRFRTLPRRRYEVSRFVRGPGRYASGVEPRLERVRRVLRARGRSLGVLFR